MSKRTNEEWLEDLRAEGSRRAGALTDLRSRLTRGMLFYLRSERSDLADLPQEELQHMAEDFVQDAILKVMDNLDSFRGESQFTTWASKIATRVAISELRRARYKDFSLEYLTAEGETMPSITSLDIAPQQGPQPESYAERRELLDVLRQGIDNVLTERQRAALTAYTVKGVPIEEIAQRMNTNRNALYKLVHDARVKLKKYIEEQGLTLDYVLDVFADE